MWDCWTWFPWRHGYGFGGFGSMGLVFWIVVIAAAIWFIRSLRDTGAARSGARADRDDAMRILKLRLAEGKITEEEFKRLKQAVES